MKNKAAMEMGKPALQAKSQKEGREKEEKGGTVQDGPGYLPFIAFVSLHAILLCPHYIYRIIIYCI